jgi:polyhydroxyalkanoate synthesis regulator phasin
MNEHRRRILDMLAEGKITADEAERLITALETPSESAQPAKTASPRYLRVMVDADEGTGRDTPKKVNIRVPLQLLRAGVRLSGMIPEQARERVNQKLRERGIALDIAQLKPENIEELIAQLNDLSVDVDAANGHRRVKVFCE